MSDEQINIAIAEACGWKVHPKDKWLVIPPDSPHSVQPLYTLPDYCNDLNAMHDAEKVLIEKCKGGNYWFYLREILEFPDAESDWDYYYYLSAIHATARQRAESFLRTLGKWEEAK